MAKRPGDEPSPDEKPGRSEPNLELPSFRLGRRKKAAVDAPAAPIVEKPTAKRPPAPPRVTPPAPPKPPAPAPRIPPQPPALQTEPPRRPPAPPKPEAVATPQQPPKPPAKTNAPTTSTDVGFESLSPREPKATKEPKAPKQPKPPKAEKTPRREKPARPVKPERPMKPAKPAKLEREPKSRRSAKPAPLPWLRGWLAALITGAACGALTVLLAWATAQGCQAVRGVGTCGSFGIVALVAILGIDVIVASALLRAFGVVDPATTSVLGVGLVAVAAMVFFLKDTQSQAMVYVIPSLMAAAFMLSWWLTKAIAQRTDD